MRGEGSSDNFEHMVVESIDCSASGTESRSSFPDRAVHNWYCWLFERRMVIEHHRTDS